MVESGFPDFVMPGWGGLIVPAGTPKDILGKLNLEIRHAVARSDIQQRLIDVGMEPAPPYSPGELKDFIRDDIARWTKFVAAIGIEKLRGELQ
jgi:tripartite-type tricarboxylate transporter receptor subunit TctC